MSRLEIVVDRELCLGAQNCRHIAPGVFEIADDGLSRVISDDPAGLEAALAAAESCPSGAIAIAGHWPKADA
jgi:ferredoxin